MRNKSITRFISALLSSSAEITQNSLWGGDLEAYILQAAPRGQLEKMPNIMITGETVIERLGKDLPDGTILGAVVRPDEAQLVGGIRRDVGLGNGRVGRASMST